MTALVVRLFFSLAFIALLLWFAARVAKKRGLGPGRNLIEVVARQRMSRSSSVTVLRVVDRVFVVGATEEQITLLAEMDADAVETAVVASRPIGEDSSTETPATGATPPRPLAGLSAGLAAGSVFDRATWSAFIQGLREKTVRRS